MALAFRRAEHERALLMSFEKPLAKIDGTVLTIIQENIAWILPSTAIGENVFAIENSQFMFEGIATRSGETLFLGLSKQGVLIPESVEMLYFHNSFFVNYFDLSGNKRNTSNDTARQPVAVFTHAYQDDFILQAWEKYYSTIVDRKALYILHHDPASVARLNVSRDVNVIKIPSGHTDPRSLAHFCSTFQRFLLSMYKLVIHVDVDEFLLHEVGTKEFVLKLADSQNLRIIRPKFAYDLVHDHLNEPPLDPLRPMTLQRSVIIPNHYFKKPALCLQPATWGLGFHYAFEENPVVEDKQLWLIRLAFVDLGLCIERHANSLQFPPVVGASYQVAAPDIRSKIIQDQFSTKLNYTDRTVVPPWMKGLF